MGGLSAASNYSITKWSAYEIVAVDPLAEISCVRVTITIERKLESVVWVQEPINQTKANCKNSDTAIRKWTIEDPPFWKRVRNK